eukprot:scaffold315995_cov21-Tisochrysis_lutea.AAC.1
MHAGGRAIAIADPLLLRTARAGLQAWTMMSSALTGKPAPQVQAGTVALPAMGKGRVLTAAAGSLKMVGMKGSAPAIPAVESQAMVMVTGCALAAGSQGTAK